MNFVYFNNIVLSIFDTGHFGQATSKILLHYRLCDAVLERLTHVSQSIINDKVPSQADDAKENNEEIVGYINGGKEKSAPHQASTGLLSRKMILFVLVICILYPMFF